MMKSISRLLAAFCICFIALAGQAATLLPPGEITFLDNNGNPISGGMVYFYIPNTLTPKDTYKDAGATILNTNPIVLDSAGRAIIYGSGIYRQIVTDSGGNLIWDQSTADTSANNFSWGGTTGGTANAQTVTAPNFTNGDGQTIGFVAGLTNTGATTLAVNGGTPINILKATSTGPVSLSGGEIVAGNQYEVGYSASSGTFQLVAFPIPPQIGAVTNISSASTTDLGTVASHNASISGNATINSFGNSASAALPIYYLQFQSSLVLTRGGALQLPYGSNNITTVAGDTAVAMYLGSGNWQIVSYQRTSGFALANTYGGCQINGLQIVPASASVIAQTTVSWLNGTLFNPVSNETSSIAGGSLTLNTATSGNLGIDTGTVAASTWYNVWLLSNGSTVGAVYSLSATAPTLPSGDIYECRLGSVETNSSTQLLTSRQAGRRVAFQIGTTSVASPLTVASGAVGSWTSFSIAAFVPPTAVEFIGTISTNTSTPGGAWAAPNCSYGAVANAPAGGNYSGGSGLIYGISQFDFNIENPSTPTVCYQGGAGGKLVADGWVEGGVNAN